MKRRQRRLQIWLIPVIIGVLTLAGLISALVLDKTGDVISWITLLVPVIVTIHFCIIKNLPEFVNNKFGIKITKKHF